MNLLSFLENAQNWGLASGSISSRLGEHLLYTVISVAIAALVGIPLGILVGHTGRGNFVIIGFANAARAIPTLGFVILMVLLITSGLLPVLVVLAVLALPPILTATAAGVAGADRAAVHAARALGMTGGQVISKVEWPLALPLVISGIRSATLQVVATATVAAYASAGGLGRFIIDGLASQDYPQMFAGAVLVALLAIVLDVALGAVVTGLRRRSRPASTRATSTEVRGAADAAAAG